MSRHSSSEFLKRSVSMRTVWHAYIIRGYCDVSYNVDIMNNAPYLQLIKDYLRAIYNSDEWSKKEVLDFMKDRNRHDIKEEARRLFPSIFLNKRPAFPLELPMEFPGAVINVDAIRDLKIGKIKLNGEFKMEDNNVSSNTTSDGVVQVTKLVDSGEVTKSGKPRLKETSVSVNVDELTLDNFQQMTGRRFRMTKAQKAKFGDDRENAFKEFLQEVKKNATTEAVPVSV